MLYQHNTHKGYVLLINEGRMMQLSDLLLKLTIVGFVIACIGTGAIWLNRFGVVAITDLPYFTRLIQIDGGVTIVLMLASAGAAQIEKRRNSQQK